VIDPYETLGVDRGATESDVRGAYRRAAKKAHPDAGGTSDAFEALSQSLALLTDKKRREHYDRTGEWQPNDPANPLSGPMSVLMTFFNQVVTEFIAGNGPDPTQCNLVAHGKIYLRQKLETLRATQAMGEKHLATVEKISERLAKKGGADHLKPALEWQARQIREQLKPVVADIESHTKAIDMLAEYTFTADPPPMQNSTFWGTGAAGRGWVG